MWLQYRNISVSTYKIAGSEEFFFLAITIKSLFKHTTTSHQCHGEAADSFILFILLSVGKHCLPKMIYLLMLYIFIYHSKFPLQYIENNFVVDFEG